MEKRNTILISNPHAGRGGRVRARKIARFCEELRALGIEVEVAETNAPGHATLLAEKAARAGLDEIVVSGGDGTINEALQGVSGTNVRLAIWPTGTANVLARELRLPFDATAAAEVFARGRTQRVSIGRATDERSNASRYFFLMAGVGLDASVARGVRPRLKRRMGAAAFWYSGLEHLALWKPESFEVEIDGQTYPATFTAIGNAPHYGSNLAITPRARLDSPEFEVCIVNSRSRFRYLYLLTHAMRSRGVAENLAGVRFLSATRVRATGRAHVQADGEIIGQLPMSFHIVPAAIEIIVP